MNQRNWKDFCSHSIYYSLYLRLRHTNWQLTERKKIIYKMGQGIQGWTKQNLWPYHFKFFKDSLPQILLGLDPKCVQITSTNQTYIMINVPFLPPKNIRIPKYNHGSHSLFIPTCFLALKENLGKFPISLRIFLSTKQE